VATYSIKEVAPVFGFEWQAEDAGGLNSEAWYGEWFDTGYKKVLDKIVEYNLDDVRAMDMVITSIHRKDCKNGHSTQKTNDSDFET
jgi:predicted RecB family nuclease